VTRSIRAAEAADRERTPPVTTFEAPDKHPGEARLRSYLAAADVVAEILAPRVPMPTVPLAAAAIGVREEQIIKSVLFRTKPGEVVLAIASGSARIDRSVLSQITGLPGLKLADAPTVMARTGYPAGGVAPVGHASHFPVVIDRRVMELDEVYGGAGSEETLLRISPVDIERLTGAIVADIVNSPIV
jgi:prolyl-tRNA editing enzyme YbaK/EbsC (Cys-tRNA(Pro) deacylase)